MTTLAVQSALVTTGILAAGWLAFALFCRWLLANPRGDVITGIFYRSLQIYSKWRHGLEVDASELVRANESIESDESLAWLHDPTNREPLVIVCNHTAGLDPLVVQAAVGREIRWMMGSDMMLAKYDWFWKWAGVIPVNRTGRDLSSAKEAIKHLNAGGTLGVFPEGRIAKPRGTRLPFMAGVGVIVAKTGAHVLPVVIEGTPETATAWGSLAARSKTKITLKRLRRYDAAYGGKEWSAAEIVKDLEGVFESAGLRAKA